MPYLPGRAGLTPSYRLPNPPSFARPGGNSEGNNLPPVTGRQFDAERAVPGPHPPTQPMGGQLGDNDGFWGSNNYPNGAGLPPVRPVLGDGQETFRRYALQGFNDKLRVVDRHAYYDTGRQDIGTEFRPGGMPNTYNDPVICPPRPDLRTVNRSVTWQVGSDNTANQDDLARPYTWLGEQGSGWAPVYGGVPGLYEPYGTRGGYPYPIVSQAALGSPGDGRQLVWSGPPHGLHSLTYPNNGDTLQRYAVNPQMRPVRFDRPSNSPQAGQSYNQTVVPQGGVGARRPAGRWTSKVQGRGWLGAGS
jgi:hypothetical protein